MGIKEYLIWACPLFAPLHGTLKALLFNDRVGCARQCDILCASSMGNHGKKVEEIAGLEKNNALQSMDLQGFTKCPEQETNLHIVANTRI